MKLVLTLIATACIFISCIDISITKDGVESMNYGTILTYVNSLSYGKLSKENFDKILDDKINEWGVQHNDLSICILGKTGVGKSSLINSLFQETIAIEGGNYYAETKTVDKYTTIINDVTVSIYDTPGLFDTLENNDQYLDMIKNIKKVDIILLVYDMSDKRIRAEDIEVIKTYNTLLGSDIMKYVVIVLSFANEIPINEFYYNLNMKTNEFRRIMNIYSGINDTEVVPAGYSDNLILDNGLYWYDELWSAIFDKMKTIGKPAFFKIRWDAIHNIDDYDEKERQLELIRKQAIKNEGCIGKNNMIRLKDGSMIMAKFLKIGQTLYNNDTILYIYRHHNPNPMINITILNQISIYLTPNHIIEVFDSEYNQYQYKRAGDLTLNDLVKYHSRWLNGGKLYNVQIIELSLLYETDSLFISTWSNKLNIKGIEITTYTNNYYISAYLETPCIKLLYYTGLSIPNWFIELYSTWVIPFYVNLI